MHIGDWHIDPVAGRISRDGETVRVEARTLKLLLVLAQHPGETVSIDELLEQVWSGVVVTPDSVYQAVATLRRLLGDDPKQARYIATVPRLGYRLVAAVRESSEGATRPLEPSSPLDSGASAPPEEQVPSRRLAATIGVVIAGIALLAALISLRAFDSLGAARHDSQLSVGVAPFVDLTPSMDQDALADDMTVGVADRLGRNPALHTAGSRSSYYLIGKQVSTEQVGRALGVAYVVDGSVRRSGDIIRIVTRLVRADSGVVLWSQVRDQPLHNLDAAQDEIARDVAATLMNIGRTPG